MSIDEVVEYYGNLNQACIAIGIAPQNMTKWRKQGYIPWKQQFKLSIATKGKLKADKFDPIQIKNSIK